MATTSTQDKVGLSRLVCATPHQQKHPPPDLLTCCLVAAPSQFLQVLPLLLQHGSTAVTLQLLCSLLQASSTVNRAMRQARARCCVDSHALRALATPAGLSSFRIWLKGHAGLVSTLALHTCHDSGSGEAEALHNVLLLVLQLMHACATAPVPGQAAPLPLQLESFTVQGYRLSAVLLAGLAPTQVQQLDLVMDAKWLTPALGSALGGLHSLRCLFVTWRRASFQQAPAQFQQLTAAIGQLQGLTRLSLSPTYGAGLQHLPTSMQSLDLQRCGDGPLEGATAADLQHLTALQRLSVHPVRPGNVQLQLPAQLSSLMVEGSVRLQGCHVPCRVKVGPFIPSDQLADMLQDLSTHQGQPWQLELALNKAGMSLGQHTGAALAACTSLTSLKIRDAKIPAHLPWSKHVALLRQLRRLQAITQEIDEQDRLMLTALTCLTGLVLWRATDFTAVSLACSLTRLRALKLFFHDMQTATFVPPVARLTDLRHLHLACISNKEPKASSFLTPAVLSLLLPLTQLTYLHLPLTESVCPGEAQRQFVGQMPGLSCIKTDWGLNFDCPEY